jgi:hypothetical protein
LKAEIRKKAETRIPKKDGFARKRQSIRVSAFGLLSGFGFWPEGRI